MDSDKELANEAQTSPVPCPQRERWQPLRSGFVNLYRYDREEFHYENGRLLLRGNNGTGKSRVLAFQLPFLLDGEVTPQRMEPDADPAKRVEWNLLMGRYPDRTGYTWIEFGRRDDDGKEYYLTLGCGLSAVEGQSGVRKWFFITTQRIGKDLELVSESKQVIGKQRLSEKIGSAGQVIETAGAYRRAVNQALFHLDEYRYASFVNLLIQLRRPQLTRRFDEDELSRTLSEALPPVSSAMITDVAEAFRILESDRSKLESFKTALNAVERFLTGYRTYAQIAARRRADRVRAAHQEYEAGMKEILVAEADCDRSLADMARLKSEIQRLANEQYALQAEIAALEQSPQMKAGHGLDQAYVDAKEKRREADMAAAELAESAQLRKMRSEEHIRSRGTLDQRQARLASAADDAAQAAISIGLENVHLECGPLEAAYSADEARLKQAREKIENGIQSQLGKAEHGRTLNQHIASARNEFQQGCARRDQLAGLLDDARERLTSAQREHSAAITAFVEAVEDWRANLAELRVSFEEALSTAMMEWSESPFGPHPFDTAIRNAVLEATRRFDEQRVSVRQLETKHADEVRLLKEEQERIANSSVIVRNERPGAPLWQLCDFVDGLDDESRGGIEAALEAAGLLSAWVTPSGEVLEPEDATPVLVASTTSLAGDEHLGTMLVPFAAVDTECQVPPEIVADIFRRIGAKPDLGHTWITANGRWQNGLLHGRSQKAAAEYIGTAAREMARDRRVAELDAAIAQAQARCRSTADSIDQLSRREQALRQEASLAPLPEGLRAAYDEVVAVAREVDRWQSRLAEAESYVGQKRYALDEATGKRNRAVVDLGIGAWVDDMVSLATGIANYRLACSSLWLEAEAFLDARKASEKAWSLVEEAVARENRQKEITSRLERRAVAAEITQDSLRQTVGGDFDQILLRLDQARQRLESLKDREKQTRAHYHETEINVTRVDERLRNRTEMLNGQNDRRDAAASALRTFAGTGLLHLAMPEMADADALTWPNTRAVEVAFEVAHQFEPVDAGDHAWEQHQKSVPSHFNGLMQSLSAQGCQSSATFRDDVFVATALFAGQERTMEDLRQLLSDEVTGRQMLLDAREREILENHLVGAVSRHLGELLNAAEEQVRQMNIELESRPMSTGMKLRFAWRPAEDGPFGLADIRRRLMQSNNTWTSAERSTLGAFLQEQIQAVCSDVEAGTWQESLAEALDYRKWHRFGVERYQDGAWKRLTRRTHGTGSGGEKAIALTLPYFAAAAAFYRTANPLAPRLIILDEAFVGIDADMRAKCMGLIHTFDLDFMMTSEREWGCYPTLPGIAIYQLSTRPDIEAIGLTRWVWNGQQRSLYQPRERAELVHEQTASDAKRSPLVAVQTAS